MLLESPKSLESPNLNTYIHIPWSRYLEQGGTNCVENYTWNEAEQKVDDFCI